MVTILDPDQSKVFRNIHAIEVADTTVTVVEVHPEQVDQNATIVAALKQAEMILENGRVISPQPVITN